MLKSLPPPRMDFTVNPVKSTDIDHVWKWIRHFVYQAVDGCNVPDVKCVHERLKHGAAQLWLAHREDAIKAIAVTRLSTVPEGKICEIWFCVGSEAHRWLAGIADIEKWAKEIGCIRSRFEARPGLEQSMKQLGYTVTHITVQKTL